MPEKLVTISAVAAPLMRSNVDTDAIIPSREMKLVSKSGLAAGLFANWRYLDVDARTADPAFVLNQPRYAGAAILLAGPNFGCGSSREHAVWALREFGFRAVLAPSFGAIFQGNCVRNGVLPAVLDEASLGVLAAGVASGPPRLAVELAERKVVDAQGRAWPFEVADADREMLMEGLDPIGVTLKATSQIRAFEAAHREARPWVLPPMRGRS